MTFVHDIELDFSNAPIETGIDDYCLEFMLGALIDNDEVVLMSTMLAGGASFLEDRQGVYDLRFGSRTKYIRHD